MLKSIQKNSLGLCIQDGGQTGIKLSLDGIQDLALRLSPQQARALACDLIQYVNRAEKINALKKSVLEKYSIAGKVWNETIFKIVP